MAFFSPVQNLGDWITDEWDEFTGKAANERNVQLAHDQMDFQERMSNSAYQRSTADMKKAGLNPMLAYSQGGASSPSGAMATTQPASSAAAVVKLYDTFSSIFKTQADTSLALASKDLIKEQTPGASAQSAESALNLKSAKLKYDELYSWYEQYLHHPEDKGQSVVRPKAWEEIQIAKLDAMFKEVRSSGSIAEINVKLKEIEEKLNRLGIPKAQAMSRGWSAVDDVTKKAEDIVRPIAGRVWNGAGKAARSLESIGKKFWNRSPYGFFHKFKE